MVAWCIYIGTSIEEIINIDLIISMKAVISFILFVGVSAQCLPFNPSLDSQRNTLITTFNCDSCLLSASKLATISEIISHLNLNGSFISLDN